MKGLKVATIASLTASCHAFIGFSIPMYKPNCAFACRGAISGAPLACSDMDHAGGHSGHGSSSTTPACFAEDSSFLTTLAWCISDRCRDLEAWRLEQYWWKKAAATSSVRETPKWTYQQSLDEITEPPTRDVNSSEMLDFTGIVSEEDYEANRRGYVVFEESETRHSTYAIVLLVAGAGIPVLMTAATFLPGVSHFFSKLKPLLLYPSVIRRYHVQSLPYLLGNPPTSGQAGYIAIFLLLNITFTAVGYRSYQPNAHFSSTKEEIVLYVANRTGVIAFALAPLVILFAGRNNSLLWLTNWSHSTYLLLHRWVARIFTLQVVLHSILEVELYRSLGSYKEELVQEYWIWGIVATGCCCIMIVISALWFRKAAYEVFLVLHIILAAFVIIGSWYHVELLFRRRWGYEFWLYAAGAVWVFDRLMRAVWIARNGVLHGDIKELDDSIVRIDVHGVRWGFTPGQHAYVYFPGAKRWTFWEAHPFSVVPLLQRTEEEASHAGSGALTPSSNSNTEEPTDLEKTAGVTTQVAQAQRASPLASVICIRFYLRKHSGITRALRQHASQTVLLEGPYYNHNPFFQPSVSMCDCLILLAGGIGITGILSFVHAHPAVKLYWSAKSASRPLVDDVRESGLFDRLGAEVVLNIGGPRFDFEVLLGTECEIQRRGKVGVVVCGPSSFCDDVRAAVVSVSRTSKIGIELYEEAFSW